MPRCAAPAPLRRRWRPPPGRRSCRVGRHRGQTAAGPRAGHGWPAGWRGCCHPPGRRSCRRPVRRRRTAVPPLARTGAPPGVWRGVPECPPPVRRTARGGRAGRPSRSPSAAVAPGASARWAPCNRGAVPGGVPGCPRGRGDGQPPCRRVRSTRRDAWLPRCPVGERRSPGRFLAAEPGRPRSHRVRSAGRAASPGRRCDRGSVVLRPASGVRGLRCGTSVNRPGRKDPGRIAARSGRGRGRSRGQDRHLRRRARLRHPAVRG
ncbi:hypothetical protein EES40_21580 [Streptomyces sp. ADI93-02]|nr:hypothetical protein EES40_21580 [Streptomyces sp. ADI93-02]